MKTLNVTILGPTLSSSIANNKVTGLTSVQIGGTLAVVNIGSALAAGDAISLFEGGARTGAFATITPEKPGPGLAWDTSTLLADGNLRVASSVDPTSTNVMVQVFPQQVVLSWPSSHLGWTLQAQTNSPGVGLGSNWVDVPGSANVTEMSMPIDSAKGSVFYRMILR